MEILCVVSLIWSVLYQYTTCSSTLEERKKKKDEEQPATGDRDSAQPHGGSEASSPVSQERGEESEREKECDDDRDDGRIVPTLKIGVDGKIIIDENR